MGPDDFAQNEYAEYILYTALSRREKNKEFREVLERLAAHEKSHFDFWKKFASRSDYNVSPVRVVLYRAMRRLFGITFFIKFVERKEQEAIRYYREFLKTADERIRPQLLQIIEDEEEHERSAVDSIKERKVEFTGSIILGLNDGLIELTGALVGFTSAFNNSRLVAASGLITGIAASMSMAASAYMSERHDGSSAKDPKLSALYTGVSYIIVVLLLVAPFFLPLSIYLSLATSFIIVVCIIAATAFYTSVLFERSFIKQFSQMLFFSVGVALVAYLIGFGFRVMTGISV